VVNFSENRMTETIKLGGREFALRPLTLGQLRHLLDALDEMAGASGGALIDAAAKLVKTGLVAAHPELTVEAVLDCAASLPELNAAVAGILQMAGLHPKELGPGEAGPVASARATTGAAIPASSSAPSTAPSPPAAATPTA
jgi:hypothetical protein